jgi:hypothetical protein
MREGKEYPSAGSKGVLPRTLPHSSSGKSPLARPGVQPGLDENAPEKNLPARRRHDTQVTAGTTPLLERIAEYEALQSVWKSTEQKLEVRNQELTGDASRMTARLSLLEEELDAASRQTGTFREVLSKERSRWRVAAAAGVIALIFLCALSWRATHAPVKPPPADPPVAGQVESQPRNELPLDPHGALATAIDRLDDALGAARGIGIGTDEALRRVSANGKGCRMVWRDDLPSVLFGGGPVRRNSLANTLADCAQAVSRLH